MPDIRLTRIDNRLIHGQVATQWCGVVGANLLLVANDEVANDEFRQGLMNMAAPICADTFFQHREDNQYHPQGVGKPAYRNYLRVTAGCA